jgi:hypothetical protein
MKRVLLILALLVVLIWPDPAGARGRRHRGSCSGGGCPSAGALIGEPVAAVAEETAAELAEERDALDEVNAARAARGLPPYVRDQGLATAALGAARWRAARLVEGHTANDFGFLPAGSSARAAGCAAWPQQMGFGSCCMYERWHYAGAAWVIGRNRLRYCHIFVR